MSSRITETFAKLQAENRMAFMPFITAGDPDLETTALTIRELAARGVDLIEIGFPYSDPIADGPVIQASYTRSLGKGLQISQLFATVSRLAKTHTPLPPLVGMVSYAIIFRMGQELFVKTAAESGFSGLIVPDLPADEAAEMAQLVASHGLDLVQLIAPTTTPERTKRVLEIAQGFIYCISIAGTTGVRDQLPAELLGQLKWLKTQTKLPLAVGFGISRPEQVDELRGLADGIIVGSAIVRQMAAITTEGTPTAAAIQKIGELAAGFVTTAHRA
ncbi:MAG: tryptophan synthase subunit alpha [Planctomycetota bacterium]